MAKELTFEEQKKLMKYEHDLMVERMKLQRDLNIEQMREQERMDTGVQDHNPSQPPAQQQPPQPYYYPQPPQPHTPTTAPTTIEESQEKYGGVVG